MPVPLLAGVFSTGAIAGAKCVAHPKAEWMKADARARIRSAGLHHQESSRVDGNCYEIYGTTKEGKEEPEIYYDTKTLDVVKSEIEK
ncbi:PepSY domain-containing protein [Cupriavidus basilensis]